MQRRWDFSINFQRLLVDVVWQPDIKQLSKCQRVSESGGQADMAGNLDCAGGS